MRQHLHDRLKSRLYPEILHEGEVAPDWSLPGHDGAQHSSLKAWTVLIFYPRDDTPTCASQLQSFNHLVDEFTAEGCRLFGLNPGSTTHGEFAKNLGLQFPLLIDVNGDVARQYRCRLELPLIGERTIRTVYLINPEKTIRLANRGNPNPAIVLRSIIALKQTTSRAM
jgi:thioredoxin-dependent peroxiredoxin